MIQAKTFMPDDCAEIMNFYTICRAGASYLMFWFEWRSNHIFGDIIDDILELLKASQTSQWNREIDTKNSYAFQNRLFCIPHFQTFIETRHSCQGSLKLWNRSQQTSNRQMWLLHRRLNSTVTPMWHSNCSTILCQVKVIAVVPSI